MKRITRRVFLGGLGGAAALSIWTPGAHAATFVSGTLLEDAHCAVGSASPDLTNTDLHCGVNAGGLDVWTFARYQLNVPRNATITAAGWWPTLAQNWTADYTLRFYAELAANSAAYGGSEDLTARSLTTAYQGQTPASQSAGHLFALGGCESVIEEVVGQEGWAYGNEITMVMQPISAVKGDTQFYSAADEHGAYSPLGLYVTYTGGDSVHPGGSGIAGLIVV